MEDLCALCLSTMAAAAWRAKLICIEVVAGALAGLNSSGAASGAPTKSKPPFWDMAHLLAAISRAEQYFFRRD